MLLSSFFTAIVFWAILKWDGEDDKHQAASENETLSTHPNRWILFIAYMIGLSIGVHLLNLLAIPAIVFVVYFKKYKLVGVSLYLPVFYHLLFLLVFKILLFLRRCLLQIGWNVYLPMTLDYLNSGALFFIAAVNNTHYWWLNSGLLRMGNQIGIRLYYPLLLYLLGTLHL